MSKMLDLMSSEIAPQAAPLRGAAPQSIETSSGSRSWPSGRSRLSAFRPSYEEAERTRRPEMPMYRRYLMKRFFPDVEELFY